MEPGLLSRVTIVVVTYESAHCLPDLSPLLSVCPHVIIVDNASTDGTPIDARSRWPHAEVIVMPENRGFGAANNAAIARVGTPFALLLNPDCRLTPETLESLVRLADSFPDAAIVAPQLVDARGRKDRNYRWPRWTWKSSGPAAEGPTCVGFVSGAAMLWRLSAFDGVGFFDEEFFLYYEDDDLCLRLFRARRPMILASQCIAVHEGRGSVRGKGRLGSEYIRGFWHARSKLILLGKHRSLARARKVRIALLIGTTVSIPFRILFFSPRLIARMLGRWQGLASWRPRGA